MNDKSVNLLSKITLKGIGAQPKPGSMGTEDKPESDKPLAVLYGRATKSDIAVSNYGESVRFHGSFEAVTPDGKTFKAGKIFLPSVVEALLHEALLAADGSAIDFALEVGVKYANNARGYEYTVKPLHKLAESDELAALRGTIAKASFAAALPAPEPDATPADGQPEAAQESGKGGKKK